MISLTFAQLKALIREATKPDSGPFEVGDAVKHGKYKNKKAKIVKIYNDDKDHVAVELEPQPKGRKKNVEMGLYKIWPSDNESDSDDL